MNKIAETEETATNEKIKAPYTGTHLVGGTKYEFEKGKTFEIPTNLLSMFKTLFKK